MKQPLLTLIFLCCIFNCQAQWTASGINTYTTNSSGNVAVGTNSLPAKFTVYQGTGLGSIPKNSTLLMRLSGLAGTTNDFQNNIWLVRNASGSDWGTTRLHDGISIDGSYTSPQTDTKTWWERDPNYDVQSWGTLANTYLTIKSGNVGIGTINPDEKLAVNGTVHSKAVRVDMNGWADYVFQKDYKLKALSWVEAFIEKNSHLPEIPSATEVAKNGQDLGEMNKLLLKKVEELTLYLIDLDKKVKTQSIQIDKQSKQIAHLIKK